jgi:integrase/recombinase XerD
LATWQELPRDPESVELVLAEVGGVSDETRYDVWVAMRLLFRWVSRRYSVPDAAALVERPVRRRKVVRTLTVEEVDRLLGSGLSRRDRALLMLLLDTGMRIGEAASLTWKAVGTASVVVAGKTGRREIPVSPVTVKALMGLGSGRCVWAAERGGEAVSVGGLQKVVRRALGAAGLGGGPHMLRHTFGRLYVMAGGDVFSLQRIMGHADVGTTRRYVEMDLRDVQAQHARFSPVAVRAAGGGG